MKKKLFFLAAATIALASCSNEEVIEQTRHGKGIDFRASIARGTTTRGTETTTATLSQFYVTAMDGNSTWFSDVLFKKQVNGTVYQSDEDYLWPSHDKLDFYAWGYTGITSPSTDNVSVAINGATQNLTFTTANNIADQIDIVTAYINAGKSDVKENGIDLTFNHALCQIEIKALSNNKEYYFDVCGYAICKVKNEGVLALKTAGAAPDAVSSTMSASSWTIKNSTDDYVKYFEPSTDKPALRLGPDAASISEYTNPNAGYIMPIPQQLTAWDHIHDSSNSRNGAFLALLVKITNKSSKFVAFPRGDTHETGEKNVNAGAGNSEDVDGYGWACVPIDTKWEPGYRYIYTLDFTIGAGQFDPKDPYQPGEDILGGPIKFNVTVADWKDANLTVNMNAHDIDVQSDDNADYPVGDVDGNGENNSASDDEEEEAEEEEA